MLPLRSRLLAEHGFRHGFSPRRGGVSASPYDTCNLGRAVGDEPRHVEENRRRFAAAVGFAEERLFEVDQVHGREVLHAGATADPARLRAQPADGLVAERGVCVGVRTADCVPVLLADPTTRCAAALHAGWRGAALGVVGEGIAKLCAVAGAPPERLIAALFPHIGVCCFEVSDDVAATLAAAAPAPAGGLDATAVVVSEPGQKPHVDLAALLRLQLAASGLQPARVEVVAGCTQCDAERFFSYRRDGRASGRHLTVILAA